LVRVAPFAFGNDKSRKAGKTSKVRAKRVGNIFIFLINIGGISLLNVVFTISVKA
jgi:hypothetical protein